MSKKVKKPIDRAKLVDKRVARAVFDAFTMWRSSFPQAFHQVTDTVRRVAANVRGAGVCVREMVTVESCAKLGLYAGINGKSDFKITFPHWLKRRWKPVCLRAFKAGFEYGTAKASGYEAPSVPTS